MALERRPGREEADKLKENVIDASLDSPISGHDSTI